MPRLIPDPRGALAPVDLPAGPGSLVRIGRTESIELLGSRNVGRLAYVARPGVPDVVPVNFSVHDGHAYVRTGVGPKLQAAERGDRLALEVHALPPAALPTTWANGPRFALLQLDLQRVEGRRLV